MREIKFRAWDKAGQVMIYSGQQWTHDIDGNDRSYYTYLVPGIRAASVFEITILDDGKLERENINGELMQYTGQTDKNGKEIYEGDILATWLGGKQYLHEVKWNRYGWDMPAPLDDFEVIGNIYENPELVK